MKNTTFPSDPLSVPGEGEYKGVRFRKVNNGKRFHVNR
jgi:hypothetical protein